MPARYFTHTTITLCIGGLLISGYLLYRHITLSSGVSDGSADVCSMVFGQGCDATLRSPSSFFLGLPMSGWGLVYFTVLTSSLLLGTYIGKSFTREAHLLTFWIACGGVISSVFLTGMMLLGNVSLCPLCIIVHALNVIVLCLLWSAMVGASVPHTLRWFNIAGMRAAPYVRQAKWKMAVSVVPLLVGAVMYQWVYIEASPHGPSVALIDPGEIVEAFRRSEIFEIPVTEHDATLGPDDAPHTLVIFSDFQCPACRAFAQGVHALAAQYPHELRIVFKHLPLDPSCNPRMDRNLHPAACEAALMAQAALHQQKFWELHDVLFSAPFVRSDLDSLTRAAGIDEQRLRGDKDDPSVIQKVTDDIALTGELGINSTPALFLDGRRLEDRRSQVLSILIESPTPGTAVTQQSPEMR